MFPVDCLKVDRSFVSGLDRDAADAAVVRAIVGLAGSLGLEVVFEGIETEWQLDQAMHLGCAVGQGYLWSPALPADEAMALASGSRRLRPGSPPSDHTAVLHADDDELMSVLVDGVAEALRGGSGVVVVATPEHREQLETALRAQGVDLSDGFAALDAASTLDLFLVDGAPDPTRFRTVISTALRSVAPDGRPVWAYGEMVGILWDSKRALAALQLEGLWERLRADIPFSLLCGYRIDPADRAGHAALADACGLHHSHVGTVHVA